MSLGARIQTKRKSLKLSQEYVAEQLNVSRQAVSKWETNRSKPSTKNLIKLADLFNCEVETFISPEKDGKEHRGEQRMKDLKMHVAAFSGRTLMLIGYLGTAGAFSNKTYESFQWYWLMFFFIGAALMLISSLDYAKKMGSKKIIYLDLLFLFSFTLYYILPFERSVNSFITMVYGAGLVALINIKFFIPVWRKYE